MNHFKEVRLSKGVSQATLAKISGVSICTIRAYEISQLNINNASVRSIIKLASALKVKLEDLLDEDELISSLKGIYNK